MEVLVNRRILLLPIVVWLALSTGSAVGEPNAPSAGDLTLSGRKESARTTPNQPESPESHLDMSLEELIAVEVRPTVAVNAAEPYGYGDAPAHGSNHVAPLVGQRRLSHEWTADGALRAYWGFPGLEDYDRYLPGTVRLGSTPGLEPRGERGYGGNYYLNLGLQYRPKTNLILRLDGYYLLNLLGSDLNERNYYAFLGDYPSHAPFLAVWMIYQF
jgi:hypothetical protein